MSRRDYDHDRKDGHIAAWQQLNRNVAADLAAGKGDIKPAVRLSKMNPSKVVIGWFARRVLRGELVRFQKDRSA